METKIRKYVRFLPKVLYNNLCKINLPTGITLEDLVCVSSLILRLGDRHKDPDKINNHMVPIAKNMFENEIGVRKLGKKKLYSVVLMLLDDNGIISIDNGDNSYFTYKDINGNKITINTGVRTSCNEYMINYNQYDLFVEDIAKIEIQNPYLNKKTTDIIRNAEDNDKRKKVHIQSGVTKKYLRESGIDYKASIDYLKWIYENKIPYKNNIMTEKEMNNIKLALADINEGNLYTNVCQTNGRVDTSYTNMRSDFLQFIKGNELIKKDISNSQPLLVLLLIDMINNPLQENNKALRKHIHLILRTSYNYVTKKDIATDVLKELSEIEIPNQKELEQWRTITQSGKFYEHFMEWFRINNYSLYEKKGYYNRDNMKEAMFAMLYKEYEDKILAQVFPSINNYINKVKKVFINTSIKLKLKNKKARMFAITMQGIESFLWVRLIQQYLGEKGIKHYGIHDCVIIEKSDAEEVDKTIRYIYSEYGLQPNISTEAIDKKSLRNKQINNKVKGVIGIDLGIDLGIKEDKKEDKKDNNLYFGDKEVKKPKTETFEDVWKLWD